MPNPIDEPQYGYGNLTQLDEAGNPVQSWGAVSPPPDLEAQRWNRYAQVVANMRIDRALAAVQAAEQFVATRLMQQDIAKGMDPAEAMMKRFAPVWGNQPRYAGTAMRGTAGALPPRIVDLGNGRQAVQGANTHVIEAPPEFKFTEGPDKTQFWNLGDKGGQVRLTTNTDADSGELLKEEIAPGIWAVRPKGSKSVHIVKTDTGEVKPLTLTTAQSLFKTAENMPKGGTKDFFTQQALTGMSNAVERANAPKAAPAAAKPAAPKVDPRGGEAPAAQAKSPYADGTRIRSKKDGKIYVVRNGVPVPEEK